MRFERRNVLVTGGASGIGLAIAREFLAEGARVLVADRDRDGLAALPGRVPHSDRLDVIETDLGVPGAAAEVGALADDRLGGLDVLVNNAGLMREAPVLEIDEADLGDELFAVNLRAGFFHDPGGRAAHGRAAARGP